VAVGTATGTELHATTRQVVEYGDLLGHLDRMIHLGQGLKG
jgi:hypothetical protein